MCLAITFNFTIIQQTNKVSLSKLHIHLLDQWANDVEDDLGIENGGLLSFENDLVMTLILNAFLLLIRLETNSLN